MTLAELLALLADLSALDDEQLAQLLADLRTAADERLDGDLNDDVLAELQSIAEAVDSVNAQTDERVAEGERIATEAQALADRIRGEASDDGGGDGDGEGADAGNGEGTGDGAGDDGSGDGAGDGAGDDGGDDAAGGADADSDAADADADADVQPVAASAAPAPRVSRVAARRPASMAPRPRAQEPHMNLTASANLPGIQAGARVDSPDMILRSFDQVLRASAGYRGPRMEIPILRAGSEVAADQYGAERSLGRDAITNEQRVSKVASPKAIRASGGICAPATVTYDLPIIGDDTRPVRDTAMTRFGADRGGVRLFPAVTLEDVADSVDLWTNANDILPAAPVTKPCLKLTCPIDEEEIVEAITKCIEVGNFRARFFAEQVEAWMQMAAVQHARVAENQLIAKIAADSTHTTSATVLGTSVDVLTTLDRAVAGFQSRHRAASATFRLIAPFWLLDQMLTDIARTAFGTAEERLAVADATVETFFRVRGINVTWTFDGESGQIFGPQLDGSLVGWPSTAICYFYAEGSWLFLDGGSLDFGIVRDSVLNSTNDFQMFSETMEGAAFHGVESLRIVMDTCPDGSVSAPVDINPCATGS